MSRKPTGLFKNGAINERWAVPGICFFLAWGVWVVFGQTIRFPFINYDDNLQLYGRPELVAGLNWHSFFWAFEHRHTDYWHPLDWLSQMLGCQLFGLWPGGHHLLNVLFHAAAAIALFLVLRNLTGTLWRSAFVAAVFAIHPQRVESVAWISERKDILHGLFMALTIGAYARYARNPWSLARYLVVVVFFALGLMSKPTLMPLPVVLLLLDYWPLNRFAIIKDDRAIQTGTPAFLLQLRIFARLFAEKIPLLLLSLASCLEAAMGNKIAFAQSAHFSTGLKLANAAVSYVAYARQMFVPTGLAVLYPFPVNGLPAWEVIGAVVLLILVTLWLFIVRRRYPYGIVGWLWYLVMLLPMIGIIQAGLIARADRYTYLPMTGLYIAVSWGVADLAARWRQRCLLLGTIMAAIIVGLMVCAYIQTTYWRSSGALWSHTLDVTSRNGIALTKLGNVFEQQGQLKEAGALYAEALEIDPNDTSALSNLGLVFLQQGHLAEATTLYRKVLGIDPRFFDAHYNLGNILRQQGKLDEAIAEYRQAVGIVPDRADAQNNLGNALAQEGRLDEAMAHFRKVLDVTPGDALAHYNLANILQQKGSIDESIDEYQRSLQIDPGYADAHNNLALALLQKGREREAIAHFQKVLGLQPGNIQTANNLAYVLATSKDSAVRNGAQALTLAQHANQLTGGNQPVTLIALAAAYAETGKFTEASATAQKALQLSDQQGSKPLSETIQAHLKLYEASQPLRENP